MARGIIVCFVALAAVALLEVVTEGSMVKREVGQPVCKTRPESCRNVASSKPRVVALLSSGIEVMCDTQTDGGGWTVFQRRVSGALPFYRGWEEYKYGFGDVADGEFYLGNENIHQLTSKSRIELRIDFSFQNVSYFAKYSRFRVYGEQEGYRIKVSGFTGNAGDSFGMTNDMKFTTYDRDQDSHTTGNCAELFKGGWWYLACHYANLNGIWGSTVFGEGLNWYTLTEHNQSVTMTEMKLRQIRN